jgi:hypothetical protein
MQFPLTATDPISSLAMPAITRQPTDALEASSSQKYSPHSQHQRVIPMGITGARVPLEISWYDLSDNSVAQQTKNGIWILSEEEDMP